MYKRPLLNSFPSTPKNFLPSYGLNKEQYNIKCEENNEKIKIKIRKGNEGDVQEITRIWNEGIRSRLATLDQDEKTAEDRLNWIRSKNDKYPLWVVYDVNKENSQNRENGTLLGFISLNQFNARKAYDNVVDFSLYVSSDSKRLGIGRRLLEFAIHEAQVLGYHKLVLAGLVRNSAATCLYKSVGFREVGIYLEQGTVDGQLTDVILMEKILNGSHKH